MAKLAFDCFFVSDATGCHYLAFESMIIKELYDGAKNVSQRMRQYQGRHACWLGDPTQVLAELGGLFLSSFTLVSILHMYL